MVPSDIGGRYYRIECQSCPQVPVRLSSELRQEQEVRNILGESVMNAIQATPIVSNPPCTKRRNSRRRNMIIIAPQIRPISAIRRNIREPIRLIVLDDLQQSRMGVIQVSLDAKVRKMEVGDALSEFLIELAEDLVFELLRCYGLG